MSSGDDNGKRPSPTGEVLVAVDTGGTFTDLVLRAPGEYRVAKVASTPDDPSRAILQGLDALGVEPVDLVIHGSTVATNAVLERAGARTAFITNDGFADILAIGRQSRPSLYDLRVQAPEPLVRRPSCFPIAGRLAADGTVLESLTDAAVEELVKRLDCSPPYEAFSVCLLHSYANPRDEERLAEALQAAFPGTAISISSAVLPLFREYERAVATTLNAYVQPVMQSYLRRLSQGLGTALLIIRSDGGTVSADEAGAHPVHTLLSGPAGGVVGAHAAGRSAGIDRLISFDMGGTSTDVSLIAGGPALTREGTIGGLPLAVTTIDIHTVGAGGGSIAWCDAAGALKVGPQSAGASPGPACYGRGGDRPTVTDAHVLLGRLPAEAFLGGTMTLDRERAERAVAELAGRVGLSVEDTARGIIRVANAHMVRAIKVISLERGHDPRDFTLVAFGGAGGLHACELAQALDMKTVLIPTNPGLLSAVGMLGADFVRELSRTTLTILPPGQPIPEAAISEALAPLEAAAAQFLDAHRVPRDWRQLETLFDMRYAGQSFELAVPAEAPFETVVEDFHRLHEWRYGYALKERPVEWVSVRVRAVGKRGHGRIEARGDRTVMARLTEPTDTDRVRSRAALESGQALRGPAVVVEYSGTTWVPEGWELGVLEDGALSIARTL